MLSRHIAFSNFSFPMFIGHYAVAFAAKKYAPETSLGTLFASVQLVDLVWPVFLLLGAEQVRIDPGNTRFTPLDFVHYPITHSLFGSLGWGLASGLLYFAFRRNRRGSVIVGLCVLSHWILDAIVHGPDLQIVPGLETRVGMGLWNSIAGTIALEGAMFLAGLWIYVRTAQPTDRIGSYGLWVLAGLLMAIYVANMMGPPPPDPQALAYVALAAWIFPFVAGWIDRHRKTPVNLGGR